MDLKSDSQNLSVCLLTVDELINNLGYSYENQSANIIRYNNNVYSWLLFNDTHWTMSSYNLDGYVDEFERL